MSKHSAQVINRQKGFTLLELVLVIGLIALTAGVSGDIILSLVRTYSKTKITNEIEQGGNIALLKLEKELRSAVSVDPITNPTTLSFRKSGDVGNTTYAVANNVLQRTDSVTSVIEPLIDTNIAGGIIISNNDVFTQIQSNPDVIRIKLVFRQAGTAGQAFTGDITLENTVVVRGTY